MTRADYCGDGVGWTKDGTLIDLFDDLGVNEPESSSAGGLVFEAGWDPDGAVCISHTRYHDLEGGPACLDELPRCPTWDRALDEGAWLGNRSKHQVR